MVIAYWLIGREIVEEIQGGESASLEKRHPIRHRIAKHLQSQFTAIREALVNLLMHSDYFSPQKPRNPVLARIFRMIRLAESAGSGFDKMFKEIL